MALTATLFSVIVGCAKEEKNTTSELNDNATLQQKIQAATTTAASNSNCVSAAPFYWEIGNADGVLASGTTGDGSVTRSTSFGIASSSKWMFGAYMAEVLSGTLDTTAIKYLTMSSGYTSFGNLSCSIAGSVTVNACHLQGTNEVYTAANDGKFYYGGGHFQKMAVANGMGAMDNATLAADYKSRLGSEMDLSFSNPQLAGGVVTNAASYAIFLKNILNGQLRIKNLLGTNSVCTVSSATCTTAVTSPIPDAWHYSIGHWVENDANGDGAYSSAGMFGFYPWIDSSKTYYGILSRYKVLVGGNDIGSGYGSALCGKEIRKAFMTGSAR